MPGPLGSYSAVSFRLLPGHAKKERDSLILQTSLLATWSAASRRLGAALLLPLFRSAVGSAEHTPPPVHSDGINNLSRPHGLHYVMWMVNLQRKKISSDVKNASHRN